MIRVRLLVPALLIFGFTACSLQNNTSAMPADFSVAETSLYLSRASLHSTDFEQYKLSHGKLYQECGNIRRGRHVPIHQQLFDLSESQKQKLMEEIWQVLELSHSGNMQLADPGSADTMFDPGRLSLVIEGNGNTLKLFTSLDTISDATAPGEIALNRLSRDIRGLTKPGACGQSSFYGLGHE